MIALIVAAAVILGVFIPVARKKDREDMERQPKHRAEPDGAPQTREEVTSGWINPSQARMAAWEQKQELTR